MRNPSPFQPTSNYPSSTTYPLLAVSPFRGGNEMPYLRNALGDEIVSHLEVVEADVGHAVRVVRQAYPTVDT
jgi:hypothetical protein